MCGIVGYIGDKKASPILINGLLCLEYRGYDSAGIATLEADGVHVMKDKGRVKNLYALEGIDELEGCVGIAHTRWATHGKPSKENAHPHSDNACMFSVVHNGIIENFAFLRDFLTEKGYHFLSQTDTEVIPNLIHYYFTKEEQANEEAFLRAFKHACDDLKGSYAIQVISPLFPDRILAVRKDSPLVIGTCKHENHVASDIPAILTYTKNFYLLNDLEFVVILKDTICFYDHDLKQHNKAINNIDWDSSAATKEGYEDFMLKEIFEQPTAIRETIGARLRLEEPCSFADMDISEAYLKNVHKIWIVACGTAMHAGLVAKNLFEKLCHISTEVDVASEFRYRDPILDEHTLCIFISQSGETADTIAALKLAKSHSCKTLVVTNVIGSSITREADYTIYTHAGPEIAVASTKAYTSQVVLLAIVAIYFAEQLDSYDIVALKELKQEILELPAKVEEILGHITEIEKFARRVYTQKDMFFLGRGIDHAAVLEGSLKLKEISYIHSEAYAAGELKHGPIALIENGICVVCVITDPTLVEKSISNIQEVITRGAKTFVITNQFLPNAHFDAVMNIPEISPLLSPILSVIPMQLLSYYISKKKGLDVDKPRNLAKSVTVE